MYVCWLQQAIAYCNRVCNKLSDKGGNISTSWVYDYIVEWGTRVKLFFAYLWLLTWPSVCMIVTGGPHILGSLGYDHLEWIGNSQCRFASDEAQHCHFLFRFACLLLLPHRSHCGVFWLLGTSSGKYGQFSGCCLRFKCGNVVDIHNGIMFDFYLGLPHMP